MNKKISKLLLVAYFANILVPFSYGQSQTMKMDAETIDDSFVDDHMKRHELLMQYCVDEISPITQIDETSDIVFSDNDKLFKVALDRTITDPEFVKNGEATATCFDLAATLGYTNVALEDDLNSIHEQDASTSGAGCENCSIPVDQTNNISPLPNAEEIVNNLNVANTAEAGDDELSCKLGTQMKENPGKCAKDLTCNLIRSGLKLVPGVNIAMWGRSLYGQVINKHKEGTIEDDRCIGGPSQPDCLTSALSGIIGNLTLTAQAIWGLGKGIVNWAGNGIKNGAKKFWKWLSQDPTNKSANAAHVTATMDDKQVVDAKQVAELFEKAKAENWTEKQFKREAEKLGEGASSLIDYSSLRKSFIIADVLKSYVDSIEQLVKSDFGCTEWEGKPHFSKCLKPMEGFGCLSCNKQLDVICGIIGYVAVDLFPSVITGGGTAMVKNGIKFSAAKYAKVDQFLIKKFPKTYAKASSKGAKAIEAASKKAKSGANVTKAFVSKASGAVFKATKAKLIGLSKFLKMDKLAKALSNAVKSDKFKNFTTKLAKSVPGSITVKLVKGVGNGVKSSVRYMTELNQKLAEKTVRLMDRPYVGKTSVRVSAEGIVVPEYKIKDFVKLKQSEKTGARLNASQRILKKDINKALENDDFLRGSKEVNVHLDTKKYTPKQMELLEKRLKDSDIKYTKDAKGNIIYKQASDCAESIAK